MPSVQQPWTFEIPLMQQTVLLGAIRAPDNSPKYSPTKMLLRWYRRCILLSAMDQEIITNPHDSRGGSFTGPTFVYVLGARNPDWERALDPFLDDFFATTDSIPIHFFTHFMHGVEIIGYKHPDERIRNWWHDFYIRMAHMLHLFPESEEQLDRRLGDNRDQWLERADPATVR